MPIPNRNGQPPKSSKSAAPAIAVARRVGALLPAGHFYDFAARHTGSPLPSRATTTYGRLRRLPDTTPYREQARGATSGQCWPGRLQKLQTSEVLTSRAQLQIRPAADSATHPPSSAFHTDTAVPATNQKVSLTAQRWPPVRACPLRPPPDRRPHRAVGFG